MCKVIDDAIEEINNVSAALDFICSSIECHESEGREINASGVSYLVRLVNNRSNYAGDLLWRAKSVDTVMQKNNE